MGKKTASGKLVRVKALGPQRWLAGAFAEPDQTREDRYGQALSELF